MKPIRGERYWSPMDLNVHSECVRQYIRDYWYDTNTSELQPVLPYYNNERSIGMHVKGYFHAYLLPICYRKMIEDIELNLYKNDLSWLAEMITVDRCEKYFGVCFITHSVVRYNTVLQRLGIIGACNHINFQNISFDNGATVLRFRFPRRLVMIGFSELPGFRRILWGRRQNHARNKAIMDSLQAIITHNKNKRNKRDVDETDTNLKTESRHLDAKSSLSNQNSVDTVQVTCERNITLTCDRRAVKEGFFG